MSTGIHLIALLSPLSFFPYMKYFSIVLVLCDKNISLNFLTFEIKLLFWSISALRGKIVAMNTASKVLFSRSILSSVKNIFIAFSTETVPS